MFGENVPFFIYLFLIFVGLRLSIEDMRHLEIPLLEIFIYGVAHFFLGGRNFLVFGLFLLLSICAMLIPIGLGEGDLILLAIWGLSLSLFQLIGILFFASLVGIFYIILRAVFKKSIPRKLPFIPFLTAGLFLMGLLGKIF